MKICVIGAGYVGLVTGACFAEIGHQVICVDNDSDKIETLNDGKMPIFEPHLEELVQSNRQLERLSFSSDTCSSIRKSEVIFICVGTPPLENGSEFYKIRFWLN